MSKSNNVPDYGRACVDCDYHEHKPKSIFHKCTLPVDLVTGRHVPIDCRAARQRTGHCGPGGRNFTPITSPMKVAAE